MTERIIIAGSREFTSKSFLQAIELGLDQLVEILGVDLTDVEVFSGCAPGIDTLGEEYAAIKKWPVRKFPADWKTHGKKAGPLRNQEMIDAGATAALIVCLDDSKGSQDMARRCEDSGVAHIVLSFPRKGDGRTWCKGAQKWLDDEALETEATKKKPWW